MLSKRLAQCMNANLPSGVHRKTLATYALLFERIGPRLAGDVGLYASGLFPAFRHVSTQLKVSRHRCDEFGRGK